MIGVLGGRRGGRMTFRPRIVSFGLAAMPCRSLAARADGRHNVHPVVIRRAVSFVSCESARSIRSRQAPIGGRIDGDWSF